MRLFITIPCMDEADTLPLTLNSIKMQTNSPEYYVTIVVNQPEQYIHHPEKNVIFVNNQKTLAFLQAYPMKGMEIIDCSSPGYAWNSKHYGVGWARKTAMDNACSHATDSDIIISLDADTIISPNYLRSIRDNFLQNPDAVGMAIPYYHSLTGNIQNDYDILRYEIYMRTYALNMWGINNPYSYTAIGSGMACTVAAYKSVNGITPRLSGEDFYFLLKLRKHGRLILYNSEPVYPSPRYSDRVFFGTGPALIKGRAGDWTSYPVYHPAFFDEIEESFASFEDLFVNPEMDYPMKQFLQQVFRDKDFILPLVKNASSTRSFVRLCMQKIDALRILQYLRYRHAECNISDEKSISAVFARFFPEITDINLNLNPDIKNVENLNQIRNTLYKKETEYQFNHWKKLCKSLPS